MVFRNAIVATGFAAAILLTPVGAQMASAAPSTGQSDCLCLASVPVGAANVGAVTAVNGHVYLAAAKGYTPLQSGAQLPFGAELKSGPEGSAVVQVGANCTVNLGPNTDLSVTNSSKGMCVREIKSAEGTAQGSSGAGPFFAPGVAIAGAASGGAVYLGLGHNHAVSQ